MESGDLRCPPSEQRHYIYLNKAHYGPVSRGGAAPSISVIKMVVVTGGTRSIGNMRDESGRGGGNGLWGAVGRGGGGSDRELRQKYIM